MKKLKILLYGDQNLNIMDGSAIWLTSLANILLNDDTVDLTILLKTPIKRNEVINNIKKLNDITLLNPFELKNKKFVKNILKPEEASELIQEIDKKENFDLILIRGKELALNCIKKKYKHKLIPYVTDFNYKDKFSNDIKKMKRIYKESLALFVQTEEMKKLLVNKLNVSGEKLILLPPTVYDSTNRPAFKNQNYSIVYTGKFSKLWETESLLKAFNKAKESIDILTLNVAGDKFQNDLIDKKEIIIDELENTSGINWVGAVTRDESIKLIEESDIGFAFRSSKIDNDESVEISTKLLEYGILGKPVLLRKTKQHIELLGEDYPLFCNSFDELVEKIYLVLTNDKIYEQAAKSCYIASANFQLSKVSKRILTELHAFKDKKKTILFAGHDFKFLTWYIEHCSNLENYNVLIDKWTGHNLHDEEKSKELLQKADIIFCEWGLGNAKYYSKNKLKGQKLYIRVHRQELTTKYLDEVNYENVTKVIAISPHIFEELNFIKNVPRNKMVIIPNMVDNEKFNLEKNENIDFNIGLLGYLPKLKRLDRALTILEKLYKIDKRFKLFIKGKHPKELPWLQNREEEMKYFKEIFERIKKAEWKNNVVFDPHGDDVGKWFKNINYILSTSEIESFHLAPMEGMVSGTKPIIFNWPGSETLYPKSIIVKNEDEAVELILKYMNNEENIKSTELKNIVKKYDKPKIISLLDNLLDLK